MASSIDTSGSWLPLKGKWPWVRPRDLWGLFNSCLCRKSFIRRSIFLLFSWWSFRKPSLIFARGLDVALPSLSTKIWLTSCSVVKLWACLLPCMFRASRCPRACFVSLKLIGFGSRFVFALQVFGYISLWCKEFLFSSWSMVLSQEGNPSAPVVNGAEMRSTLPFLTAFFYFWPPE